MRKSIFVITFLLCLTLPAGAQHQTPFDYEKFKTEMISFIANEAGLNSQQLQLFKPICENMLVQKRALFKKIKEARKTYSTNEDYKNAIQKIDRWELEMKMLEKTYHDNLLKRLPAQKVFLIIKAEGKFHKQVFRRAAGRR